MLGRMESVVLYSNMVAQMSLCGWGDSGADAAELSLEVYVGCFGPYVINQVGRAIAQRVSSISSKLTV